VVRTSIVTILAVFSILVSLPAAAFDFNVSAGLDFDGDFKDAEIGTETGYSLGLEVCFDFPIVEVGAGLEYGFPRGTDVGNVDVKYTSLYAIGRLGIIGPLYLAARVGYADVSADDLRGGNLDGGETWSAGVGAEFFEVLKVEALLNNFSADIDGVDSDFDYQTYSLRVLYTF